MSSRNAHLLKTKKHPSLAQHQDDSQLIPVSLCMLHVDYCNSALYGLPDVTINKLQHLQNMCACLVLRKTKRDSISQCLKTLHWIPVHQRIAHNILIPTHECRAGAGPSYLRHLLQNKTLMRSLRSDGADLLVIPRTKCKTFMDRAFNVAAPTLWSQLPKEIRSIKELLTFKKAVITHLFKQSFYLLLILFFRGLPVRLFLI